MRAVVQRASRASVHSHGEQLAAIRQGFVILLGIEGCDGEEDIEWLVRKISQMRIFSDEEGRMNRSLLDQENPAAIVISQFTLHASTKKGNRPSFIRAAAPDHSQPLYERFCDSMSEAISNPVGRGRFGADMQVELINDGPVTIVIDSRNRE